ncbi:MAG: glycine zipper 2TM domain-containing protein [Steroidobacteraceae bacterium]|nr:glycine zipper 2TM domain-containing protein [Nevskiaceae bacterium]MCP5360269.1 glycine zipper 2TM domain-containing protein [Nevskiaceae bacterium]MCP5466594.1 glycine zipper 2TM domain-containing protein [Nevskiaceae bacterium]
MNKSLMTGIGIGVVVAAAAGAVASFSMKGQSPQGADVAQSTPLEPQASMDAVGTATAEGTPASEQLPVTAGTAIPEAAPADVAPATPHVAQPPSSPRSSAGSAAPSFARVVASSPVVETERVAREVCRDVEVEHQKPVKDEKRVAGAALGAVIGGVLGNQVGDGDGQKLATAAGAVAGGIAGSKLQKRVQQSNTEMVTERQCETVYDSKEKTVGYDVRYRIGSSEQTVRMRTDPGVGAQLPLRNGKLIS